nr:hypothetical protein [Tanacetum cinerariifolium]
MSSLFADTYNVVAILEKSDAVEGFEQIINFLSGSYIHYALTVNPHIYISGIKQFWNTASVKRSGDVTWLQALVDKKKIVISELQVLYVSSLHPIDHSEPSWRFVTHTTRFISSTLTQKVFANMRRVRKDEQVQVDDAVAAAVEENIEVVTTAKLITKVVTAAALQISAASATIPAAKPSIPAAALTVVAAYTRRRKRVIIRDPEEKLSSKTPAETPKVKDKGKGILVETPKPMKKKDQIELDAEYARKLHEEINRDEFNKDIDWDAAMDHAAKRRKLSEEAQEAEDLRKRLETTNLDSRSSKLMKLISFISASQHY